MSLPLPHQDILSLINKGVVIPAHPLALDKHRKMNERRQRALTRYYLDSGARGMAVGVHTTQFEIRDSEIGLYKPVLELASEEIDGFCKMQNQLVVKIAGLTGKTEQAVAEAQIAIECGYHTGLLSLAAFKNVNNDALIEHCKAVAEIIPLTGFYLQPAVGGRILDCDFWRAFAQIENVIAIKIAPFNRYQTLDVLRGIAESGRAKEIAVYTGNDDNIVSDLLTTFEFPVENGKIKIDIVGGLLGHWAVWTKRVVEIFNDIQTVKALGKGIPASLLTLGAEITDCNSAFFDVKNSFTGVISGIHEVLRRQGLLEGIWTLNPHEELSPGQLEEIDRVYKMYPHLNDDDFVKENLDRWLL